MEIQNNTLPEGWVDSKISDICSHSKGKKPKILKESQWKESVPYIDIKAFETDIINRYADKKSSIIVTPHDVIIVWDGARCGFSGITKIEGALGSTLMKLSPIILSYEYFAHFLITQYDEINTNPRGSGIPHVDPKLFWHLEVPLPPLAEQKRIVAKLDELLARVNAARERLAKIPDIMKRFRQAVLTAAVTGKLTEDWREKNQDKTRVNWETKEFFDFCVLQRGYDLPIAKRKKGTYPIVTSSGIAAHHSEYKVKGPGVTVGRSGSIGKTFFVDRNFWPHNTALYVKDFKNNFPKYVYYYLYNFDFISVSASTAVPTLNRNNLRGTQVVIPTIKEQREIVHRIEFLFKLADTIEERLNKATEKVNNLTQSILAKAFRGDLVPTEAELARLEDRTYETAEELLKRIQAENGKTISSRVKRKKTKHSHKS